VNAGKWFRPGGFCFVALKEGLSSRLYVAPAWVSARAEA